MFEFNFHFEFISSYKICSGYCALLEKISKMTKFCISIYIYVGTLFFIKFQYKETIKNIF